MATYKAFLLLLMFAFAVRAENLYRDPKYAVVTVSNMNWDSQVMSKRNIGNVVIVHFYKEYDGKSKNFREEFNEDAKKNKGIFLFVGVDCDENYQLCKREEINEFPAVRVYPPVPIPVPEPDYNLDMKKSLRYASNYVQSKVEEITDDNFMQKIGENPAVPKVLLFTDKPSTPLMYKALSLAFNHKLMLGIVRKEHQDVFHKYGINSTPKIVVIKTGEKRPIEYKGENNYSDIFDFLNVYSEQFVVGGGGSFDQAGGGKPWLHEAIPELNHKSSKDICLEAQGSLCVIIFNKEKPSKTALDTVKEVRRNYDNKLDRGLKYNFMWLNSPSQKAWTKFFAVESFPTTIILNPGKRKRFLTIPGDLELDRLNSVLEKISGGDASKTLWKSSIVSHRTNKANEKLTVEEEEDDEGDYEEEEEGEDDGHNSILDENKEQVEISFDDDDKEIVFVPEWNDLDIMDQPFNHKRDAPAPYDNSVPDSQQVNFDYNKMRQDILTAAKGMDFWSYLAKNVPAHYNWGAKIPLDDLMSWSKAYTDLTIVIIRVCGDENEQASIKTKDRARMTLIKIAMEKSQRIKDEIILQLIKQVRKNKKKLSAENSFSLLGNILSICYPSEGLVYPLMNWLINMIDLHQNKAYKDWSRYLLSRVYHGHIAEDKRYFSPDPMEMAYVTNRKRVKIPLYVSNGCWLTMWIESYEDFLSLKKEALFRLGLKTEHLWRFGVMEYIEYNDRFDERFVENHHNVMDVVASWIPLRNKDKTIKRTRLFFCITASMPYLENAEFLTKLQFTAYALNLYRGKVDLSNKELGKLFALHYAADYGKQEDAMDMLERRLGCYVAITKNYESSSQDWVEMVEDELKKWLGKNRAACVKEYMKEISDLPSFAGHVFSAKFRNSSLRDPIGMPSNALILVAIEGIMVMEEQTKHPILELDYSELTNWGCSKNIFVMSLGEIHALNKFYFIMNQSGMAVWLMNTYAHLMVNKTPDPVSIETKFKFIHDKRFRFASTFSLTSG